MRHRFHPQHSVWVSIKFVIVIALLTGLWLAINSSRNLARSRSLSLAGISQQYFAQGDYLRGIHVGIIAAREDWLAPAAQEAREALAANTQALNLLAQIEHNGELKGVLYSNDGQRVLTWGSDFRTPNQNNSKQNDPNHTPYTAQLWDANTGEPIGPPMHHDHRITRIRFSYDDRYILSADSGGISRLWDTTTSLPFGAPMTHDKEIKDIVFTRDGQQILSWDNRGTLRLWDFATTTLLWSVVPAGDSDYHSVYKVFFSHDEKHFVSLSYPNTAQLWETDSGKSIGAPMTDICTSDNSQVLFSHDDQRLLIWNDRHIQLWNTSTSKLTHIPVDDQLSIAHVEFSQDKQHILIWYEDLTFEIRDAISAEIITRTQGPIERWSDYVSVIEFSSAAQQILVWSTNIIELMDAATNTFTDNLFDTQAESYYATFSRDGQYVLTYHVDGLIHVWEPTEKGAQLIGTLFQNRNYRQQEREAQLYDKQHILSWSWHGNVRLWAVDTNRRGELSIQEQYQRLEWSNLNWVAKNPDDNSTLQITDINDAIQLSHDGRYLTITDRGPGIARVVDTTSGQIIGRPLLHGQYTSGVVLSEDGQRILSWGSDGKAYSVRFGELVTEQQISLFTLPYDMSDDNYLPFASRWGLLLSSDEKRVLVWNNEEAQFRDIHTGAPIGTAIKTDIWGIHPLFLSEDEQHILTFSGASAQLWQVETGQPIGQPIDDVSAAQLSPDGKYIVTWNNTFSQNEELVLREVDTGAVIAPPMRHSINIDDAVFSDNGQFILSWTTYGDEVRVWSTKTGSLMFNFPLNNPYINGFSGARFSTSQNEIIIFGEEKLSYYDISWITNNQSNLNYIQQVCTQKLHGNEVLRPSYLIPNQQIMSGVRRLDAETIITAPQLQGREGEDVCDWQPPWYDSLLRYGIGWLFSD